jgi:hypothetical protein
MSGETNFNFGAKVQNIFPDSKFQGYRKEGRKRGRRKTNFITSH